MSSEHFQQERDPDERPSPWSSLTGPVLVKREFGFWHVATLESYTGLGANVSFPDMEELTVDPSLVRPLRLVTGELIFLGFSKEVLGGTPARLVSVQGLMVDVAPPGVGNPDWRSISSHYLREVRVYRDLRPIQWQKGDRVFAYVPRQFNPPLTLLFPGVVDSVHHGVCVEIDFDGGEQCLVPITLVQRARVTPGEFVYVPGEEWTHGTTYSPCKVLECEEESLLLQDGRGATFSSSFAEIAVFPRGYEMVDGKLAKIEGSEVEPLEAGPDEEEGTPSAPQREERTDSVTVKPESATPEKKPWWRLWG